MLGVFKTSHHHNVERNKAKLRELEQNLHSKNQPSTSTSTDVKQHHANRQTNVTPNVTNVQRSATNIQAQLAYLKQMMAKVRQHYPELKKGESYYCLLSGCTDKLKRGKDIERKITNKKYAEKNSSPEATENNTYRTKQHIKNLSDIQLTTD